MSYAASYSSFNIRTGAGCTDVEGSKTVYMKVKDTAGNESTSVNTGAFTLDQTAPSSNSIAVDSGSWTGGVSGYTNDDTPQLTISSASVYQMRFSCDNSTWTSYENYATSKVNFDVNSGSNGCAAADGSKTVYAMFDDEAGNTATANTGAFVLDHINPVVSPSSPANGFRYSSPDPSLVSTSVEATAGLQECFARIDTTNPPSTPIRYVSGSIEGTDCTFSGYSSLSEGTYYWDANAMDKAGNWSFYSSVRSIVRDNTAPTVPSTFTIENDSSSPYWDNVNNSDTNLNFTALESGETCKWDTGNVAYASLGSSCAVGGTDVNCMFGSLAQTNTAAQYLSRYHACIDDVGNAYSTLGINFGVDWSAPTTSDNSSTTIQVPTYNVTITEADNASNAGANITTVYCTDGANSCTPSTGIDNGGTVSFTSAARGQRFLRYYSTDLAGNTQTVVSKTININQLPSWGASPGFDVNVSGTVSCLNTRNVLFDTNVTDADASQTLKFYVCSSTEATGAGGCAETTACSDTSSSSNSSCVYNQGADDSSHTWYGFVFDSLNEQVATGYKQVSYTCDSTLPVITPSSPSNGSSGSDNTPTLSGTSSENLANCQVQIASDEDFLSIVGGYDGASATVSAGTTCTYTVPSSLDDGTYYWRMKGTDTVGNAGNYDGNYSLTIDTTAFSTSLVSVAGDSSSPYWDTANDSQTAIIVSGESGMSCRFGTSDATYDSMSAGNECSINSSQATCSLGALTQGANKIYYVSCEDSLGNDQTTGQNVDVTFGVDWTAPSIGQTAVTSLTSSTYAKSPANIESSVITDNVALNTTTCEFTINNGSSWSAGTWSAPSAKCVDSAVALSDGSNTINYRVADQAGNTGTGTSVTYTKDNDAPTGLTLGFGTITASSITATVSGASDAGAGLHSTPYYFEETGVPSNSGYQSGSSWVDSSLDVNALYTFRAKTRDVLLNESAFTATQSRYTLSNIPGVSLSNAGVTTLDVSIDANSNPVATQFAVYHVTESKWLQADGSRGVSEQWQTASQWSGTTATDLNALVQHCFRAKSRNGNLVQTALGTQACSSTQNSFVKTTTDANGFFAPSTTGPPVFVGIWQNLDANVHLYCSSLSGSFSHVEIGDSSYSPPGTLSWTNVSNDTNLSISDFTINSSQDSLVMGSGVSSADANIILNAGSTVKWDHFSAWIEKTPEVRVNVRARVAGTRAGLSDAGWSAWMKPDNVFLQLGNSQWVEFNIDANNTNPSNTINYARIRKAFADYIQETGENACSQTLYRRDTDSGDSIAYGAWASYDSNILFSQDGNYALQFYSTSLSGNSEYTQRVLVLIDKVPATIALSQSVCSGIQDSSSFNINWDEVSTSAGVFQYKVYLSTDKQFTNKKLIATSSTAQSTEINLLTNAPAFCGDGVCSYGEKCPQDSLSCPYGQVCSSGCQVKTNVDANSSSVGDAVCTFGENDTTADSWCQTTTGDTSSACISGCVPTSNSIYSQQSWDTNTSASSSGYCGDGYCDSSEFCPFDNPYCGNGYVCENGCVQIYDSGNCGDASCSDFENCSLDNTYCTNLCCVCFA